MSLIAPGLKSLEIGFLVLLWSTSAALAQSAQGGCTLESVAGTANHILRCQQGLSITIEAGARYTLVDRDGDGRADAASLHDKALLLDGPAEAAAGFQVVTPQAIAAVRGTRWAVDVQGGKTSVFVVRGQVAVRRTAANEGVTLGPGDGVDVASGSEALVVRRWPVARVSALMARFGQ